MAAGGRGAGCGWVALPPPSVLTPGPALKGTTRRPGPRLQEALPAPRSASPGPPAASHRPRTVQPSDPGRDVLPPGPGRRRRRSPLRPAFVGAGPPRGSPPQTRARRFTCSGCARPAATPAGRSRSPLHLGGPGTLRGEPAASGHTSANSGDGLPRTPPLPRPPPSRFRGKPPRRPPCGLLRGRPPPTAVGTPPRVRRDAASQWQEERTGNCTLGRCWAGARGSDSRCRGRAGRPRCSGGRGQRPLPRSLGVFEGNDFFGRGITRHPRHF